MSGCRFPILIAALLLILPLAGCACDPETVEVTPPSGPFLGQTIPGGEPVLFAPGIISTGMYERDVAMVRQQDGVWTEPEIASFSQDPAVFDFEPFITADGSKMYFLSTRAPEGQDPKPGWGHQNIWVMDREGDTWSEAREVGPPVNSDEGEFYPSLTTDGTLYFTRGLADGRSLVFRSPMVGGVYAEPEQLPEEVNSVDMQFNAFIAPDRYRWASGSIPRTAQPVPCPCRRTGATSSSRHPGRSKRKAPCLPTVPTPP
ncbi:MAG: PD40 domain-containing protein [Acidobacteria bacterium]|uniref:PD40 domain-containing protein n=1 Tax=Candidatus Polarisedimenticola svalbardensis TaxID=2886004 RepID=A0A8J6Y226_9BACT|nr:PD40 domain-containing protein [Candidatus Polarisedimenticola svalbardensis]